MERNATLNRVCRRRDSAGARVFSSGALECMNIEARLAFRKAYGHRAHECRKLAPWHALANLPPYSPIHRL